MYFEATPKLEKKKKFTSLQHYQYRKSMTLRVHEKFEILFMQSFYFSTHHLGKKNNTWLTAHTKKPFRTQTRKAKGEGF